MLAAVIASFLLPSGAQALQITPLYFSGSGGNGFDPVAVANAGLSPLFVAGPSDGWVTAGDPAADPNLMMPTLRVQRTGFSVLSNPTSPSFANPAIFDVTLTITNLSAMTLTQPLLVFTGVSLGGFSLTSDRVGLDAAFPTDPLEILQYSFDSTTFLYGVLELCAPGSVCDLAPNQSVQRTIRYVVAGALPVVKNQLKVPDFFVAGLNKPAVIPEPSTVVLLALGLVALGGSRRLCR